MTTDAIRNRLYNNNARAAGTRAFHRVVIVVITIFCAQIFAQGLQYEPPIIPGFEPPFTSQNRSPLTSGQGGMLRANIRGITDTAAINFEGRQLTFSRVDADGNPVWTYHYPEFSEFVAASRVRSFHEAWYDMLTDEARRRIPPPPPRLQWELAVHYPPWAQRLLGNTPPRLRIEGRLQLTAAYERTSTRTGEESPIVDVNPLDFTTDYDFSITGSVGRLISVNISHSRQDGFDFGEDPLKNFKVEYKESEPGELEDEIIQEIVLGYTGFDMPGTTLSGYSERHDGLFGARIRAKFGPLMLTGIVSQAQGEALSMELGGRNDPNAGAPLRENEFIRNRYFFLNEAYKAAYNGVTGRVERVDNFQAFVSIRCEETAQTASRRFMADIDGSRVCFRMLEENREYIIDRDLGVVRFEHNVRDEDIIAITLTSVGGRFNVGTPVRLDAANNSDQDLALLKPRGMEEITAQDERHGHLFGLMWRNVYHLSEVDGTIFDVYYLDPAVGDTIRHVTVGGSSSLISHVLGITDAQGRPRTDDVDIFNLARQELVIPPWGRVMNGNEPFANPDLGERADTSIYRIGQRTTFMQRDYVPKFAINTGGSGRRTSYDNLGWNILPGTVTVRTNSGTLLVEGEDYDLDYQMGIIDLLSTRARAAESIVVTYQRESDFVLDRKIFAGLRGEMRLPFISENSFMAASLLYQNAATTADDIPNLGNEPFSKLHLSFNTSLDFEPEWMTRAVNLVPLVNAEEPSAAKIDFEIVHSSMNSNTSRDRAAYIDDFERTKDAHSLSMRHVAWHPSHYPFAYPGSENPNIDVEAIAAHMLETGRIPAWHFYWFTPNSHDLDHRVGEFSVWQRDAHSARQSTSEHFIDVLRLRATPAPDHSDMRGRFGNAYASVTASLGRNGVNMENHRYLEMVINPVGLTSQPGAAGVRRGKLVVQIGTFSHDQVRDGGPPNGNFDLEDTTFQNSAALLSQFDFGLNRRQVEDKFYVIPNNAANAWDTLSRTSNSDWLVAPRSFDNPSGDRFQRYDRDNLQNFRLANGTWGNSLYDSENIDNDGVPRIRGREEYFSYEIDLDLVFADGGRGSPYVDQAARLMHDNGWRFLRIPLKEILNGAGIEKGEHGGGADWSRVRGVRLVWYDFDERVIDRENELMIAGIELVGNYWDVRAGSEGKVEPTSISNHEDEVYAASVLGTIVRPKAGERTPEERSLRLRFAELESGDTALVTRNMRFNPQNLSGYDSVAIMVHDLERNDGLDFILRFGSDDSTFYELRAPLAGNGWNRFAISLQDLSDLKLRAEDNRDDSMSVEGSQRVRLSDGTEGILRVAAPGGRRPNFTAVTYIAVGAALTGGTLQSGEIWVNELIAAGARRLSGVAARFDVATQWSDFLSLAFGAAYTSGDFRTMTESTFGHDKRSEISANASGRLQLDRFLPEEWGVSLPVGGSVSGALTRPVTKPQSDILLLNDSGNPDGLLDMAGDALSTMFGGSNANDGDTTRAQLFETFTSTRNIYASFERTGRSDNPLINFTLDRIKTDVSYNIVTSHTARGSLDPETFRTDTAETYTGALRYDLSPRNPPSWVSSTPFENVGWLPGIYRRYKLNLLPSTITFDLAEVQHRAERRSDPRLNVDHSTRTFDMRHGMRVTYAPIDPLLALTYTSRLDRDLSDIETDWTWDTWRDETFPGIFSLNRQENEKWDEYGVMHGERGRTQTASMRLSPQVVTWLTHTADYSASYTAAMARRGDNDPTQYLNAGVGTSLRIRNALLLADLLKKFEAPPPPRSQETAAAEDTATAPTRNPPLARMSAGVGRLNIRSINFDYEVTTDLRNSFLTSTFIADTMGLSNFDFFMYQVGLRRSPTDHFTGSVGSDGLGWMQYRAQFCREDDAACHELYRFDQSRGSWSARFSTALTIPEPIRINVTNVSYGWGREFFGQPDTTFIDTTIVLPEIRAAANTEALMKLSFVKSRMTRLTLNSSLNYRLARRENRERYDTTTTLEFQPLISLDGRFVRWPALSAGYRYSRGSVGVVTVGKGRDGDADTTLSTELTRRGSHALTLAYEFTNTLRFQELRLGGWVIPIQGKTNIGLTVNREHQVVRIRKLGDDDDEVRTDWDFNYSPFLEYMFTDNVRGSARYLGTHKYQGGRRINQQRFALSVEVTF